MGTNFTSFIDIPQRSAISSEQWKRFREQIEAELRVALPAVVVQRGGVSSFDSVNMTVSVQPALKEELLVNGVPTPIALPQFDDVPVLIPRAGGYAITFPVQTGDECLLVFSDVCLDSWWQSGGIGNIQMSPRRHDLSDAIAIFGLSSNANILSSYASNSLQVRDAAGSTIVEIAPGGVINVKATHVNIGVSPTKHLVFLEDLITLFNNHVHTDPQGGLTGVPTSTLGTGNGTSHTVAD